jgi:murein DD-endopeptidase MepM/ murein hydrolase activator NlpD
MSCGCESVGKSGLWAASPEYRQPTDIQYGENIDCYMARSGNITGQMDDSGPQIENRVENTSLASDKDAKVDETLKLTPNSEKVATRWTATVDNKPIDQAIPGITFDPSTGKIGGQAEEKYRGKNYKVMVTAYDSAEEEIDAREFNFYPKDAAKEGDGIRFVFPLVAPPGSQAVVTCKFGPRSPPASGASKNHKGIDIACTGKKIGTIVAAADGVVYACGPASGFGCWIILDHKDSSGKLVATTVYGHMYQQDIYVKTGQRVSAGQAIAKEGNNGIGSGAHLHFEVHKGGWGKGHQVDPLPYLNGDITAAENNEPIVDDSGKVIDQNPTNMQSSSQSGRTMVAGEASSSQDCNSIAVIPNSVVDGKPAFTPDQPSRFTEEPKTNTGVPTSNCKPEGAVPPVEEVKSRITAVCQAKGLTPEETDFILQVAKIESTYNPYAKNSTSSATGLYQFLDSLANAYYPKLGYAVTCENRCDIEKATEAMILFYQTEMKAYWTGFVKSGKMKIAGKNIHPTSFSGSGPFYTNLSMAAFMYGGIHHDGVGNMVKGIDKGGVAYWKSRGGT